MNLQIVRLEKPDARAGLGGQVAIGSRRRFDLRRKIPMPRLARADWTCRRPIAMACEHHPIIQ